MKTITADKNKKLRNMVQQYNKYVNHDRPFKIYLSHVSKFDV